jgi:hypothetical protein
MEWCVAKTGFEMFDAFHAYGLAVLLASVGNKSVEVQDVGPVYCLSSAWSLFLAPAPDMMLEALFALPTSTDLLASTSDQGQDVLPFGTLDGLLTALFTQGERILSVSELRRRQRVDEGVVQKALNKGTKALQEWKKYVGQASVNAFDWLEDLLRDYAVSSPVIPVPGAIRQGKDLTAVLTLDPSLGYSIRRPRSDGLIRRKINIALHDARYATLLAYLGATRFLRAQRVTGNLFNLYVPLAWKISIDAYTTMMPLAPADGSPHQALALYLLSLLDPLSNRLMKGSARTENQTCQCPTVYWARQQPQEPSWRGLAYQMLQSQGIQQSLSLERGTLACDWIVELERRREGIIRFWQRWLDTQSTKSLDEQEHLVDGLLSRGGEAWVRHLCDMSWHVSSQEKPQPRRYSEEEVKYMIDSPDSPLSTILEREEGTLRFGRALRQLGRYNPSILLDLLETLESVRTLDQLLRVLHYAMQQCLLAKAKSPYILIPSNHDLALLTTDANQYGVPLLASLLMILSTLRSARRDIDKYAVHTLIGALLGLVNLLPPPDDDIFIPSSEADASATLPEIVSFSSDEEGEPDV